MSDITLVLVLMIMIPVIAGLGWFLNKLINLIIWQKKEFKNKIKDKE